MTVGGGLLGLEAAKAMTDLEDFGRVSLIDRNKWVMARQLDADAGTLVTRKIRELGLDVLHQKRVAVVNTDSENNVTGITFEDGEQIQCCCICFAVSLSLFTFFPVGPGVLTVGALDRREAERRAGSSSRYPVRRKRWFCDR